MVWRVAAVVAAAAAAAEGWVKSRDGNEDDVVAVGVDGKDGWVAAAAAEDDRVVVCLGSWIAAVAAVDDDDDEGGDGDDGDDDAVAGTENKNPAAAAAVSGDGQDERDGKDEMDVLPAEDRLTLLTDPQLRQNHQEQQELKDKDLSGDVVVDAEDAEDVEDAADDGKDLRVSDAAVRWLLAGAVISMTKAAAAADDDAVVDVDAAAAEVGDAVGDDDGNRNPQMQDVGNATAEMMNFPLQAVESWLPDT